MLKFIRENPTLAFGLALPLVIILVFLGAAAVQKIGVIAPKYSVVYALNYYDNSNTNSLFISVENHKAKIIYYGGGDYYNPPKIYVYNPNNNTIHEIAINLPENVRACINKLPTCINKHLSAPVPIPELEALTLDSSTMSPDGYEFINSIGYPHDLLGGLFFSAGDYRNGAALQKGSYRVLIPQTDKYYAGIHFIGWVVPNGK